MPNPWEMDWGKSANQDSGNGSQGNPMPWEMKWDSKDSGLGQKILNGIGTAAKGLDSVTGAPVRSAIFAAQNGENPISAGVKQFGNMTDEAPTGTDIASKAGVSNAENGPYYRYNPDGTKTAILQSTPSNAAIAGRAIDIAANPLNLTGPILRMVGKVGEAASPLAESLDTFANDRALKAAGFMKKDFNVIQAKGIQDDLGRVLLNDKIVTPFATLSSISDKISEAKQAAGETIGHILDTADSSGAPSISAKDIALKLSEDPEIVKLSAIPGQEGTSHQINKFIETLYNHPQGDGLSLRDAQELRQGIDKSINYNKAIPEMKGAQPYLFKMRDAVSQAMNDSVNALPEGGELDRLKTANAAYSKLATLDKVAQNRLGALSANQQISLGDKIAAGVGAAAGHGNPMVAVGVGAINKTARAVGNSIAATSANKLSNFIPNISQAASSVPGASGPAASILTNELGKSSDQQRNIPAYSDGGYVQPPPPPPPTYIDPERAKSVQDSMRKAFHFAAGGMVPGAPQVAVNSPQNDTVLGKLSPGEVVLPLSVTQSSNPPQRAKEFMANQQMGPVPTQQMSQQTVQQDPKTGPIKWANDGFNNLKSHVNDKDRQFLEENKAKIMIDQKTQNLLISASQFSPGTKPLDDIIKHLKNRLK